MSEVLDILLTILLVAGILFIVMALLSPFESLGWWAGWSKKTLDNELEGKRRETTPLISPANALLSQKIKTPVQHYLVYLRGIATSEADPSRREQGFLDQLDGLLPNSKIISDIFPYAANNRPLTSERTFAWLYHLLEKARTRYKNSLFATLFVVRNMLQVGVSGDRRYGPIYNASIAREIGRSLVNQGYTFGNQKPIWVMGWSGAGQIAVGAARYLHQIFHVPVYVVSIGGVILDDPGISDIAHLFHLEGSRDNFPKLGDLLSPGRWPFIRRSAWNQARKEGRITVIDPGPMKHTGENDYFDHKAILPDGQTFAQRTAQVIAGIISGIQANKLGNRESEENHVD